MIIAALIGIMIAIIVGVNLLPTITGSIKQVTEQAAAEEAPITGAMATLLDVLPIVFVAMLLLGAVSWLGSRGTGSSGNDEEEGVESVAIRLVRNPKSLIIRITKASKNWSQYINNLDELLGIKTIVASEDNMVAGFLLDKDGKLFINEENYDWYLTDKNPTQDMFKVVGLHKEDSNKNLVYLLGRNGGIDTPYLIELPQNYLELSWTDCASYISRNPEYGRLVGGLV